MKEASHDGSQANPSHKERCFKWESCITSHNESFTWESSKPFT